MGECSTSTKNEFDYMEKLDPKTRKWYKEKQVIGCANSLRKLC